MPRFAKGNKEGKQWQKGQSGNPAGKPKGTLSFKTQLLKIAETEINYKDLKKKSVKGPAGVALALAAFKAGLYGDVRAIKLIFEHCEGKQIFVDENPDLDIEITADMTPEKAADAYKKALQKLKKK